MTDRAYDVVVVGSGTAGVTAAHSCADAGLAVALVERAVPGGTCALRGCQPKKYFVVQAELAADAAALAGRGVARPPDLDWREAQAFKRGFTDAVPERTRRGLADRGIDFVAGDAAFAAPGVLDVDGRKVRGRAVILATGAAPRRLDVPGGEFARTSDDFLAQETLPGTIVLVGGGYISFEFAHVAAAFGSRVVILNRSPRVLKPFDADLAEDAVAAARDAGIEVHLGTEPAAIRKLGTGFEVVREAGDPFVADAVFACIGRDPALGGLNLEAAGIEPGPEGLPVDERMRVAGRDDLFAVGDCAASPALAPVADREAAVAASRLTGGDRVMDYGVVPSVCFCHPPLARVGLAADEASAQGLRFEVRDGATTRWPNLRRLGARHGRYKLLVGDDGRILGAHLLTAGAGDLINVFALAMREGIPAARLEEIPWAYPTLTSDIKYMV